MIDRTTNALSVAQAIVGSLLVLAIMFLVVTDVTRRSLGLGSVRGSSELAEVMLVAAAFLCLAYAQRMDAHVGTSLVTDRLPRALALRIEGVGLALMALLFAWMTWEAGARAWQSFTTGETRFGVRSVTVWPARAAVVLGLLGLTIEIMLRVVRRFADAREQGTGGQPKHEAR